MAPLCSSGGCLTPVWRFVSAFSFLEYLPQPWFITRRTWWATLQKQTRKEIKDDAFPPTRGRKKNRNETSCECKNRMYCSRHGGSVRPPGVWGCIFSFLFATYFVLYWTMTSALHVCNKCCSVLYLCLPCVLPLGGALVVQTSPGHVFRCCWGEHFEFFWWGLDLTKKKKKKKVYLRKKKKKPEKLHKTSWLLAFHNCIFTGAPEHTVVFVVSSQSAESAMWEDTPLPMNFWSQTQLSVCSYSNPIALVTLDQVLWLREVS